MAYKQLTTLKAFPSAFGYGSDVTGGRGGSIIEVTNLNDSGAGSLRAALTSSGARIVLIKVAGTITLTTPIQLTNTHSNVTVIGQTAPNMGIQVTGERLEFNSGFTNGIFRFITWRLIEGTLGVHDVISKTDTSTTNNIALYIDHCSFSFGFDEVLSIKTASANSRVTSAYNLQAENIPTHNTGGIFGSQPSDHPYANSGKFTNARNMYYNISHRFPNFVANNGAILESYNNLIANWYSRLTRVNGNVKVDWYNNYGYSGNKSKYSGAPSTTAGSGGSAVNKWAWVDSSDNDTRFYSVNNIIEGYQDIVSLDNEDLWEYFYYDGVNLVGTKINSSWFTATRQGDATYPLNGLWTAQETFDNLMNTVGHSRGTDSSGNGIDVRDSLDASYITKVQTDTTEASYRDNGDWTLPTKTSGTAFTDTGSTGIADTFKSTHGLTGDGTNVTAEFDFGTYLLINDAGYEDREIYWAWLAGDFDNLELIEDENIFHSLTSDEKKRNKFTKRNKILI